LRLRGKDWGRSGEGGEAVSGEYEGERFGWFWEMGKWLGGRDWRGRSS